jgi:hypothetical protein
MKDEVEPSFHPSSFRLHPSPYRWKTAAIERLLLAYVREFFIPPLVRQTPGL